MKTSFLIDYEKIEKLGKGSQGECFLIKNKKNGVLRVLKQIKLKNLKEKEKKYIKNEIKIMKTINHPSIIKYYDSHCGAKMIYILLEYAKNNSLKNVITKKKKIKEKKIKKWFHQILRALKELHSKNIIHHNIKSSNILLDSKMNIKISDIGPSKFNNKSKSFIGSPYYMSPEIINGFEYDFKTDIWSLGVLIYELACFKLPFKSNNICFLAYKILKGKYCSLENYSESFLEILDMMLQVDPRKRIGVDKILDSFYFQCYKKDVNLEKDFSEENLKINKFGLLNEFQDPELKVHESISEFEDLINLCEKIDQKRGFFEEDEKENIEQEDSYSDFDFIDLKDLDLDMENIKKKEDIIKKKIGDKTFNQITNTFCVKFDDEKFVNKIYDNDDFSNINFDLSVTDLNDETKEITNLFLKKQIIKESAKIFNK